MVNKKIGFFIKNNVALATVSQVAVLRLLFVFLSMAFMLAGPADILAASVTYTSERSSAYGVRYTLRPSSETEKVGVVGIQYGMGQAGNLLKIMFTRNPREGQRSWIDVDTRVFPYPVRVNLICVEDAQYGIFPDIENGAVQEYAAHLRDAGILAGYEDGTFRPNGNITRAELVTLLIKAVKPEMGNYVNYLQFTDIDGHWARETILKGAALGWVSGYGDGTFLPNKSVSLGEAASMLAKVFNLKSNGKKDTDLQHWAAPAIESLIDNGIILAEDRLASPILTDSAITRGDFAMLLSRLLSMSPN